MSTLLAVRDLAVTFRADEGTVEAVRGVSFEVPAGRTVALVGESGSGKTVISQAIMGILPRNAAITGGRILFREPGGDEVDLAALDPNGPAFRRIRGARISIIFQEPMSSLSPVHTIGDQVGEAYALHRRVGPEEVKRRTVEMLGRVGFPDPEHAYHAYPFELSGGLRQRAMIAMALICEPALLIADEPTTALDVTIQAQILDLMAKLQRELGIAILFITHDLGVVANIAHSMVVLFRGRVMERGPTRSLLSRPQHPYLRGLLRAVPRLHTPADRPLVPLRQISAAASSALLRARAAERAPPRPGPILEVEGLRKSFVARTGGWLRRAVREIVAVDDVSFTLQRGECLAIVGESGSGKTTVSRIIMRALVPDRGRVVFHDRDGSVDVLALDERALAAFRRKIQYIFQDPFGSLNPRMTIFDIVAEPLVIHGIGTPAERAERVAALLAAVGLEPRHLRRYPHSFSGGQRQRIGIARALALEPEILICDEPVSALDVSVQAQVLNLLKDLRRTLGLTYLFISHNLAVVKYLADRIAVMCAGRIVELAPTARLFEQPRHPYTRALLAAVPEPDPDFRLDLGALLAGRASDPAAWPEPFGLRDGPGRLEPVDANHFVRIAA